ncbi:SDR family oxidoreductase [Cohnella fermenti]|uniref:SDR family oxidoreductase n=1 Tax=Cohnella fermenti TaxID=2565925 RepID=A0A4S4BSM0_9BACL|nr:SDR family oxidoreductase [Cohnella fermenti]THF78039.1 SDR family oxidoreductase [Cohnella fermenti]
MRIFITGAGRGLGFELTEAAVREGHSVIACVRDASRPGERLTELLQRYPDSVRLKSLDVASEGDAARIAAELSESGLALDAIVNNAGILLGREDGIETLSIEELRKTLEINLVGPIAVAKHLVPLMRGSDAGMVLNISSEAGSFSGAYGGDYPYAISKLALNMFTKQLNEELKPRGIRALAVHPGWIRTDMGGSAAPLAASDSAGGILDILTGRTQVPKENVFIDYAGRPMPL